MYKQKNLVCTTGPYPLKFKIRIISSIKNLIPLHLQAVICSGLLRTSYTLPQEPTRYRIVVSAQPSSMILLSILPPVPWYRSLTEGLFILYSWTNVTYSCTIIHLSKLLLYDQKVKNVT